MTTGKSLESRVHAIHYTSGDGYEVARVPLFPTKPVEILLEPDQQPFFIAPNNSHGYSMVTSFDDEPYRKVVVSTTDLRSSLEQHGSKAQPIKTYRSVDEAIDALDPLRSLAVRRANMAQFLSGLTRATSSVQFGSGPYSGSLSFERGDLVAAFLDTGKETLRKKEALVAFGILSHYRVLDFTEAPLNENGPEYVGAGVTAIRASALPAVTSELAKTVDPLAPHLFNVDPNTLARAGPSDYSVGITWNGIKAGILQFANGQYIHGKFRYDGGARTGDDALRLAVAAAQKPDGFTFTRLTDPRLLKTDRMGKPAERSALATAASYFSG